MVAAPCSGQRVSLDQVSGESKGKVIWEDKFDTAQDGQLRVPIHVNCGTNSDRSVVIHVVESVAPFPPKRCQAAESSRVADEQRLLKKAATLI